MPIINKIGWEKATGGKLNPYAKAIVKIATKVCEYLDQLDQTEKVDANNLILKADKEFNEGITGNMAGLVALLVSRYHSKGEEFRKSWNKNWSNENAKGVINPAVFTIKNGELK